MIALARILRPHRVLPRGWSRTLKCFERPDIKSRPRTAKTFCFWQRGEVSRGGLEPPTSTLCSVQCARMSEPNSGTQEELPPIRRLSRIRGHQTRVSGPPVSRTACGTAQLIFQGIARVPAGDPRPGHSGSTALGQIAKSVGAPNERRRIPINCYGVDLHPT